MTYEETIGRLYALQNPEKVIFKEKKFGVVSNNSLGIYHSELKKIAKDIGKDNELGLQLFDSGIYEARILCSKVFKPKDVTVELMEKWVKTFENWEVCDSFSMGLFAKSDFALEKIFEWTKRKPEFEKEQDSQLWPPTAWQINYQTMCYLKPFSPSSNGRPMMKESM